MNSLQKYYHHQLEQLYLYLVPKGKRVTRLGINNQTNQLGEYLIYEDHIGETYDIQSTLERVRSQLLPNGRLIITSVNFLWLPLITLAEKLKLKRKQPNQSWLSVSDIENLLKISNFEIIKKGTYLLLPLPIPILDEIFNKYLARLPVISHLCLVQYFLVRAIPKPNFDTDFSTSIIIPARNEAGNIEAAIKRTPHLGKNTELIFIEGHSKDDTATQIKLMQKKYPHRDIKFFTQKGKGKGDAVRLGFAKAKGDLLFILDADLTMPPEELLKYYQLLRTRTADFVMGSRLVYPMENEAMRFLNILGNKTFSLAFSWLLDQPIKDTLCGTKALFKPDYEQIVKNRQYFGDFDPFGDFDLIFGASKANLKLVEIPIHYSARTYGTTNISRFKHGWLLIKMTIFAASKLKFF